MYGEIIIGDKDRVGSLTRGLDAITEELLRLSINIVIAHWNLQGMEYGILHERLGEDYHKVIDLMDKVAERSVLLGGAPLLGNKDSHLNKTLMGDVMRSYERTQGLVNYFINNEGNYDEVSKNLLTDVQELLQFRLGFLNQTYKPCEDSEEMGEGEEQEDHKEHSPNPSLGLDVM